MSLMTSRVYNTTDGPLVITDEGHVLASRESAKGLDLAAEPVAGHLEAGRLIDTTDAKAEGAEVAEALADQGDKPATTTKRS